MISAGRDGGSVSVKSASGGRGRSRTQGGGQGTRCAARRRACRAGRRPTIPPTAAVATLACRPKSRKTSRGAPFQSDDDDEDRAGRGGGGGGRRGYNEDDGSDDEGEDEEDDDEGEEEEEPKAADAGEGAGDGDGDGTNIPISSEVVAVKKQDLDNMLRKMDELCKGVEHLKRQQGSMKRRLEVIQMQQVEVSWP